MLTARQGIIIKAILRNKWTPKLQAKISMVTRCLGIILTSLNTIKLMKKQMSRLIEAVAISSITIKKIRQKPKYSESVKEAKVRPKTHIIAKGVSPVA